MGARYGALLGIPHRRPRGADSPPSRVRTEKWLAEAEPTENYSLAMACARIPHAIVCLLSALRVHGIGTQAPSAVWLAIPTRRDAPA